MSEHLNEYIGLEYLLLDGLDETSYDKVYFINYKIGISQYSNAQNFLLFNLIKKSSKFTFDTLKENIKIKNKIKEQKSNNNIYKGYYKYNESLYLFFENLTNYRNILITKEDSTIWTLPSEIINTQKIYNYNIDNSVLNFFMNNPFFLFLKNKQGNILESPIVAYYGNEYKRILFTATFGHKREEPFRKDNKIRHYGSFYYFATYLSALRFSIWSSLRKPLEINGELITVDEEGKYAKGGMVRFGIFLGKTCMVFSKDRKTENMNTSLPQWYNNYNSIIVGSHNKEKPHYLEYVIKDYSQQIPLSYSFINTDGEINSETMADINID